MGALTEHIDYASPSIAADPAAMLAVVRERIERGLAGVSTAMADRSLVRMLGGGKLPRTALSARLTGDILLCHAIDMVGRADEGRWLEPFMRAIVATCMAEVEQDVGPACGDESTCLRIARGKTGPLFAFGAVVAGGSEAALASALREAGYAVGTIYQLADDLLDAVGPSDAADKTLPRDAAMGRPTLARLDERSAGPRARLRHRSTSGGWAGRSPRCCRRGRRRWRRFRRSSV